MAAYHENEANQSGSPSSAQRPVKVLRPESDLERTETQAPTSLGHSCFRRVSGSGDSRETPTSVGATDFFLLSGFQLEPKAPDAVGEPLPFPGTNTQSMSAVAPCTAFDRLQHRPSLTSAARVKYRSVGTVCTTTPENRARRRQLQKLAGYAESQTFIPRRHLPSRLAISDTDAS